MSASVLSATSSLGVSSPSAIVGRHTLIQIMEIKVVGKKRAIRVLIDSSAELNFISQRIITKEGLSATNSSVKAYTVDGYLVYIYSDYTFRVYTTDVRGIYYSDNYRFLATNIREINVILGFPQLQ